MLAEGETLRDSGEHLLSSLVLVDITPRVDYEGVAKVQGFMRAHAQRRLCVGRGGGRCGRRISAAPAAAEEQRRPEEESAAVAGRTLALALGPALHGRAQAASIPTASGSKRSMLDAASNIKVPALLVRGGSSELVQEAHAKEFLELVPHAEYVDVADARHMVAGDQNDHFSVAVLDFLGRLKG